MIAALSTYDGVLCSHCHAPIPVSEKIVKLKSEAENESEAAAPASCSLRCRICEWEGIYPLSSIRKIEGEPRRRRVLKARRASA